MQLRRLTKYSTIELEAEADQLRETIDRLTAILNDDAVLRGVVADELTEVAKRFGTPRRTVLLASSGVVTPAAPLEVPDEPCWVLLSATGLLARTGSAEVPPAQGPRANHDVIVSAVATSARGEFGVLTSRGRLIRARAIELPTVPPTASAPNLQGGSRASELWSLDVGEVPLGLTSLSPGSLGLALGTRRGVVKRVNPEVLSNKDSWEVIRLDEGDAVVGACELTDESSELTFITSDAQLLHFPATAVRPQGRAGGGMAGIKLARGASVLWFGAVPATDSVVVTISGSSSSLPGTETGLVKVSGFGEFPGKGRATGGVRCHRFLKGEDALVLGWAGPDPAIATAASGSPVELPPATGKRDGSGVPVAQPVLGVGSRTIAAPAS
ncbi:MAG: DNA gyrase C-terminal beta-propeller domain-containing protein, partial [Propionibacteriaceae bacterium]|nr:DNA gyrase C-terminal beta-propeller domain-containing protein [Propionibacteriaceae bacterium]